MELESLKLESLKLESLKLESLKSESVKLGQFNSKSGSLELTTFGVLTMMGSVSVCLNFGFRTFVCLSSFERCVP
jgi:hypothetical protein